MTATTAPRLAPGETAPRRRVLFGLLDADGWTWASVKAVIWLVVIIMLLGYIPDRAYYFTVFSTIDLGLNAWSPVNICPPSNESLPCPAPGGAIVPWQPAQSPQLLLPAPRTNAAVAQSGASVFVIGGSDGSKAQTSVYETTVTSDGNLSGWKKSADLPAARSHATAAYLSGSIYLIGGLDDKGAPTDTVFVATPEASSGAISAWKAEDTLKLPAPRADAAIVATSDGLLAIGGSDTKGPTDTVWRSTVDAQGHLGAWSPNGSIADGRNRYARSGAAAALLGKDLYLFGGSDANGATAQVLHALVDSDSAGHQGVASAWMVATNASANLPAPRTNEASFISNGALYLVGGTSDGKTASGETWWTVPTSNGGIDGWQHLAQTDLPKQGLVGATALPASGHVFLFGGTPGGSNGPTNLVERADLAPKPPVFQLGLVGATIPALGIQKEIGQQLGYLAAAGVGTVNFVLLVLIGIAMAHPDRSREILGRYRRRLRRIRV